MRGLNQKRTLITGGASGIGAAAAARFVEEGAQVIVLDRDETACHQLQRTLSGLAATLIADVADFTAVSQAFATLDERFKGLDILINNAGISRRHDLLRITPAAWQEVLAVNLTGSFYVAQQAARRMMAAGSGVILNMGSVSGMVGMPGYADYNASKAGVIELTRTLALELAPTVRVNAVCPGYVMTPMQAAEYTPEMIAAVNDSECS